MENINDYEKPKVDVICFNYSDVIATSGPDPCDDIHCPHSPDSNYPGF